MAAPRAMPPRQTNHSSREGFRGVRMVTKIQSQRSAAHRSGSGQRETQSHSFKNELGVRRGGRGERKLTLRGTGFDEIAKQIRVASRPAGGKSSGHATGSEFGSRQIP